jgi:type IV pilus assembly protein PilV
MLMKRSAHINKCQRGVGLIEVLIALLVLSFGMLGMAGLQVWSLKYNQSAMQRGMAVVETHTIADAMRADRAAALRAEFDIALDAEPPSGNTFAQRAVRGWRQSLQGALGTGATGEVDCDGALCTIRVRWDDSRGTNTQPDADGNTPPTLQVVTTVVQL